MENNSSSPPSITEVAHPPSSTDTKKSIKTIASFFERAPSYFFPFFLMILEGILRFAFKLNTQEFIGPTLAATGVGMTITLTSHKSNKVLKSLPTDFQKFISDNNLTIETGGIRLFRNLCWITSLVLTIFWIGTIILSTQFSTLIYLGLPAHYIVGLLSYLLGFVLSEFKEVL